MEYDLKCVVEVSFRGRERERQGGVGDKDIFCIVNKKGTGTPSSAMSSKEFYV